MLRVVGLTRSYASGVRETAPALVRAELQLLQGQASALRQPTTEFPWGRVVRLMRHAGRSGEAQRDVLDQAALLVTGTPRLECVRRSVWTALIAAYGRSGQPDRALAVFERMGAKRRTAPQVAAYNALLSAYAHDAGKARTVWSRMRQNHISPDTVSYNAYIHALGQAGALDEAHDSLVDMKARGLLPDVVTYTSLMQCCVQCNQPARVSAYYVEMRERHLEPDSAALAVLVPALTAAGRVDEALGLAGLVARGRSNLAGSTAVLGLLSRLGQVDKARAVLDQFVQSGVRVDAQAISVVLNGAGRLRSLQDTEELLQLAKQLHAVDGRLVSAAAVAFSRCGNEEKTRAVLEDAKSSPSLWDSVDKPYLSKHFNSLKWNIPLD